MRAPREYLPSVPVPLLDFLVKVCQGLRPRRQRTLSGTNLAKVGSWLPMLRVARYDGSMPTIRDGAIEGEQYI